MNRYSSTPTNTRWDGSRVYLTTQYPVIEPSDSDLIVISNDGDYLDGMAYKYYGDPSLWWVIALCNNIGRGRLSVPPGKQIRVPANINNILVQFNNLNQQ